MDYLGCFGNICSCLSLYADSKKCCSKALPVYISKQRSRTTINPRGEKENKIIW